MSLTFVALFGYICWTLFLVLMMEVLRMGVTVRLGRAANDFLPDGSDVSPFAVRLARAHANCYESFPVIGGVLILSLTTDLHAVTSSLALWLLAARLAQSSVHLFSGSALAAQIRFVFFLVQIVIVCWWLVKILALILAG